MCGEKNLPSLINDAFLTYPLFLCVGQLKEFQQKSSPNVAGEKGSSTGGAGAKKKRKVKGPSQPDAPLSDRNSPDNVSPRPFSVSQSAVLPLGCVSPSFMGSLFPFLSLCFWNIVIPGSRVKVVFV